MQGKGWRSEEAAKGGCASCAARVVLVLGEALCGDGVFDVEKRDGEGGTLTLEETRGYRGRGRGRWKSRCAWIGIYEVQAGRRYVAERIFNCVRPVPVVQAHADQVVIYHR